MTYPVITGTILIEANGAALNNAGQAEGLRVDNAIAVKQIRVGRLSYPYVSGQAWRRWLREVLYADFNWAPSEVTRETKSAYTKGDPITYEEDDLFGYMVARKRAGKTSKKKKEQSDENAISLDNTEEGSGTYRRISPLKNSLLISCLPNIIANDFGHFSRNLPQDTDMIPFEAEHYSTYLQGVFTISLNDVGRFMVGEMCDISEDIKEKHEEKLKGDPNNQKVFWLSKEDRIKRVQEVLKAMAYLRGGARLARNLSDVSPVVVLIGSLDGANAPFQRIFSADDNNESVILNIERLESVLNDYENRFLSTDNAKPLLLGYRPTVLANEVEVLNKFSNSKLIEIVGTPQKALEKAADRVRKIFSLLEE